MLEYVAVLGVCIILVILFFGVNYLIQDKLNDCVFAIVFTLLAVLTIFVTKFAMAYLAGV